MWRFIPLPHIQRHLHVHSAARFSRGEKCNVRERRDTVLRELRTCGYDAGR